MAFHASDHTFVVCAYKQNPYIDETIKSLLRQSIPTRIIISTSTPNEYIRRVSRRYSLPLVINESPRLAGDDWNYGYDHAGSRLVTIAHQDDYYDPRYVENVLSAANRYPENEISIIYSNYFEIRSGERIYSDALLRIKRLMNYPLRYDFLNGKRLVKRAVLSLGCPICCPAVTLVASNVGASPFDSTYKNSCDYKTWVDFSDKKGRFVYIPQTLVGHRIYPESSTSHNLEEDIRKGEDEEILSLLWPRTVARLINRVYSLSEKSNEL